MSDFWINHTYEAPFFLFLLGTNYDPKNINDRRVQLKNILEQNNGKNSYFNDYSKIFEIIKKPNTANEIRIKKIVAEISNENKRLFKCLFTFFNLTAGIKVVDLKKYINEFEPNKKCSDMQFLKGLNAKFELPQIAGTKPIKTIKLCPMIVEEIEEKFNKIAGYKKNEFLNEINIPTFELEKFLSAVSDLNLNFFDSTASIVEYGMFFDSFEDGYFKNIILSPKKMEDDINKSRTFLNVGPIKKMYESFSESKDDDDLNLRKFWISNIEYPNLTIKVRNPDSTATKRRIPKESPWMENSNIKSTWLKFSKNKRYIDEFEKNLGHIVSFKRASQIFDIRFSYFDKWLQKEAIKERAFFHENKLSILKVDLNAKVIFRHLYQLISEDKFLQNVEIEYKKNRLKDGKIDSKNLFLNSILKSYKDELTFLYNSQATNNIHGVEISLNSNIGEDLRNNLKYTVIILMAINDGFFAFANNLLTKGVRKKSVYRLPLKRESLFQSFTKINNLADFKIENEKLVKIMLNFPKDYFYSYFSVTKNKKIRNFKKYNDWSEYSSTYRNDGIGYKVDNVISEIKMLHNELAKFVYEKTLWNEYAYAYIKDSNIKKTLEVHRNSDCFVKLDIKSFFESIDNDKLLNKLLKRYI
ncbi:hypothetical protein [[Acholeplasma] multilocale]|uniref:hypothetical protein n=1 Tax=[Acholeplasma] multilocale TaxID=264638 RepID=UPI000479C731|nr:hypothetical protein [[Acholeplasma] multilocale]